MQNQSYYTRFDRLTTPKKKKRKHSIDNQQNNSNSINIVDRVLDFSKYKSDTGLYILCRDWINATTSVYLNNRLNKQLKNDDSDDLDSQNTDNDNSQDVYSLPLPINVKLEKNVCNENNKNDVKNDLDKIMEEKVDLINNSELMKLNLDRWKNIKKKSFENYKIENERYKKSYDILKSIHENT